MDKDTIAKNLRKLRLEKELSQKDVASNSEMSYVAYSNIERGISFPKPETLKKLARTLEVSIEEIWRRNDSLENVRFRAGTKMISRDRVLMDVEVWLRNREAVESFFDEDSTECDFKVVTEKIRQQIASIENKSLAAVKAAELLREKWNLGKAPITLLDSLLEEHGLKVFNCSVQSEHFFGLSVGHNGGGPAIVVNTWSEIPVERWIFTAAHELGHLILHQSAYDVSVKDEDNLEEEQANKFAGAFLMPNDAFIEEWNRFYSLGLSQLILNLKKIYMVSWKTIVYRYIETTKDKQMWAKATNALKSYGLSVQAKKEPIPLAPEDFWGDDRPNWAMETLVYKAYRKELIDKEKAVELLSLTKQKFDKFIEKYDSKDVVEILS